MTIQINELEYNIEQYGDLERPHAPLVLLHGFTGSAQNWRKVAPAVAKDGRTVLAVDLPGHGATVAPDNTQRFTMATVAQDLAALLQKIEIERVHLLGYSMGGRLALYFAVHYPQVVSTLILESASPGLEMEEERAARKESDDALADWIEANGIPAFVDRWENVPIFASQKALPQDVRDGLRQQRLQNHERGLANSLRGMGTGVQPSLWPRLAELTMPVQLIVGESDTKFVAINRRIAQQIPDVQLTVVADAGHTVHLEQRREFERLVDVWLRGVAGP